MNPSPRLPVFPLIRHLSKRVTPVLLRLPVTPNQITAASLVLGLGACWFLIQGGHVWMVGAGLLFVLTYVLDNCDGEVARIKGQSSTFGMWFDTFVDWIVHTAFFLALGIGAMRVFGSEVWLWLGGIAALGGTINFFLGLYLDSRDKRDVEAAETEDSHRHPEGLSEWVLFAFRELTRADFCFIVLALAVFDLTWLLLPAGAIGSQVYWITLFFRAAREFHV